jgi:predicted secreted Zn-dependent protease
MRICPILLLMWGCAAPRALTHLPASTSPNLTLHLRHPTYPVRARTLLEADAQIAAHADAHHDATAWTSWSLSWRHETAPDVAGCRVRRPRLRLKLTVTTPRLLHPRRLPADQRATWDRYLEALVVHEQGHVDLAVTGAERLLASLRALPPAATCSEVQRAAHKTADLQIAATEAEQEAWDKLTDHGRLQGATLVTP